MKFSENIAILRERYGLNHTEFTDAAGINRTSFWRYEKGERLPNTEILIKIANTFHVSTDWLLGRDTSKDRQLPDYVCLQERKRLAKIEKLKKELAELEAAGK